MFLSRYRGYLTCPECGGARLRREARDVQVGGRTIDVVCGLTVRDADAFFADLALSEKEAAIAEKVLAGDPKAPGLPAGRRARLPDARSAVVHAVGRRIAADQPCDVARLGARRYAVRPRRAVDRAALARQRAAHRHPAAAARPGQHGARRRARRRHDPCRRHRRRHGPWRRGAGRPGDFQRHARRADARAALADGQVPARRACDPRACRAPEADQPEAAGSRRVGTQPEGRGRRDPAGRAHLRDGRQRIGQEHAGPRRRSTRRSRRRRATGTAASARTASSKAPSSSPTSCSSTRRRSAARRARTLSPI